MVKNLIDLEKEIKLFCNEKEIKLFEINLDGELIEDSFNIAKEKLKLNDSFEWKESINAFLEKFSKLDVKIFYLFAPHIKEEDITEPDSFKSQKLLEQHLGETPFIILKTQIGGVDHHVELKEDWFVEAEELYEQGPSENEYDEAKDEDDEWEDLSDEDIGEYAKKVISNSNFEKENLDRSNIIVFMKNNNKEIYESLDSLGKCWVADKIIEMVEESN